MGVSKKTRWILLGVAAAILIGTAFYAGSYCGGSTVEEPRRGIDAGPGERKIDEKVDAATQRAEKKIEQIEEEHQEAIKSFNEEQEAEYEQVKGEGPEAVADWLTDFNRDLRGQE